MKKQVLLFGNSITAEILIDYISQDERYEICGLVVEDEFVDKTTFSDYEIFSFNQVELKFSPQNYKIIMAVGYHDLNKTRERLFKLLKTKGFYIEPYTHPEAKIYSQFEIGEGSLIMPSAIIEPYVRIAPNSVIWSNVSIAHHSIISENTWIATGAVIAGQVKINKNVFVGVNATIVDKINVGAYSMIGAGALITKDVPAESVMFSRAAEKIRFSSNEYIQYFGM
jgi:acetyltransferase-like isoleucine patch superfamily enzyme